MVTAFWYMARLCFLPTYWTSRGVQKTQTGSVIFVVSFKISVTFINLVVILIHWISQGVQHNIIYACDTYTCKLWLVLTDLMPDNIQLTRHLVASMVFVVVVSFKTAIIIVNDQVEESTNCMIAMADKPRSNPIIPPRSPDRNPIIPS